MLIQALIFLPQSTLYTTVHSAMHQPFMISWLVLPHCAGETKTLQLSTWSVIQYCLVNHHSIFLIYKVIMFMGLQLPSVSLMKLMELLLFFLNLHPEQCLYIIKINWWCCNPINNWKMGVDIFIYWQWNVKSILKNCLILWLHILKFNVK